MRILPYFCPCVNEDAGNSHQKATTLTGQCRSVQICFLLVMAPTAGEFNHISDNDINQPMLFINTARIGIFITAQFFIGRRRLKRICNDHFHQLLYIVRKRRFFRLLPILYKLMRILNRLHSVSASSAANISSAFLKDFPLPNRISSFASRILASSSSLE